VLLCNKQFCFCANESIDEEIAPWHKKAVMTCGMLRNMDAFDQQKFLTNLSELEAELKVISEKYLNNPPAEYAGPSVENLSGRFDG